MGSATFTDKAGRSHTAPRLRLAIQPSRPVAGQTVRAVVTIENVDSERLPVIPRRGGIGLRFLPPLPPSPEAEPGAWLRAGRWEMDPTEECVMIPRDMAPGATVVVASLEGLGKAHGEVTYNTMRRIPAQITQTVGVTLVEAVAWSYTYRVIAASDAVEVVVGAPRGSDEAAYAWLVQHGALELLAGAHMSFEQGWLGVEKERVAAYRDFLAAHDGSSYAPEVRFCLCVTTR